MFTNEYRILVIVLALGLLTRVAYVAGRPHAAVAPHTDAESYVSMAENLLSGRGMADTSDNLTRFNQTGPTSFWSPLYPFVLHLLFRAAGRVDFLIATLFQALLSVATAFLLYPLGRRLLSPRVALLAAILYAFHPFAIYYAGVLITETLFAFLLTLWIYLAYRLTIHPQRYSAALFGCVSGLAFLTNAVMLAFLSCFAIFCVLQNPRIFVSKRFLVFGTVCSISFTIVVGPWVIRNYRLHSRAVIVPTKGGYNLLAGNNPEANGLTMRLPPQYDSEFRGLAEVEQARRAQALALAWIKQNPGRFLLLGLKKSYYLWTPIPNYPESLLLATVKSLSCTLLLLGTVGAVALCARQRKLFSLLYLIIVAQTACAFVFFGSGRFRFPLDPVLCLLTAATIGVLIRSSVGNRLAKS